MRLSNHDLAIRANERLRRRLSRLDAQHLTSDEFITTLMTFSSN